MMSDVVLRIVGIDEGIFPFFLIVEPVFLNDFDLRAALKRQSESIRRIFGFPDKANRGGGDIARFVINGTNHVTDLNLFNDLLRSVLHSNHRSGSNAGATILVGPYSGEIH